MVASNPYDALIRMLELKLKRQEDSVVETRAQLDAARQGQKDWVSPTKK